MEIFEANASENMTDNPCLEPTDDLQAAIRDDKYIKYNIEHHYTGYDFELNSFNVTMCVCKSTRASFLVGVDAIVLSIDHFFTSQIVSGALARTYIRSVNSKTNKKVFEKGETPAMTLEQLLEWAEVELDKRLDEGMNAQWLDGLADSELFALQ
ncbi:hypothetical protein CYMTET_12900, partial [Cymbomonas tetramitiformis]